jgi:hypothetical protein
LHQAGKAREVCATQICRIQKEIRKRRREFQEKLNQQQGQSAKFEFTPPRYDQEFEEALKKIEAADL